MDDLLLERFLTRFENCETYQTTPSINRNGMFFFTDCGNMMYSVSHSIFTYHKKLCPKCGKTLFLRGTFDANEYMDWKLGRSKIVVSEQLEGAEQCMNIKKNGTSNY